MSNCTGNKLEYMINKLWSDIDLAWEGCHEGYKADPRRMLGNWAELAYSIEQEIKNEQN